jgi:hypothetical protein
LLDKYKDNEAGSIKVLKKEDESLLIKPSQDEFLTTESHRLPHNNTPPPPSQQYTKGADYKQGDLVLEWDTKMG